MSEARAASFEPPMLDSFDLRSSHEVVVNVAVPEGTRPGAYYGHILATGMPEVSLPVRLEAVEVHARTDELASLVAAVPGD